MEGALWRTPTWSKTWNRNSIPKSKLSSPTKFSLQSVELPPSSKTLSTFPLLYKVSTLRRASAAFYLRSSSSSVGNAQYTEEPATKVKFETSLTLPGCSSPLSLLGTGYREKVFAIVGVKVYAAGFYVNESVLSAFGAAKGQSATEIEGNSALFSSMFQAPLEKSLQIVLVRDVDGKTFWDALDDAISPRIKAPTSVDEAALSTFRSIFQNRSLKKDNMIILTWLNSSTLMVSVSSDGSPSGVDATIESSNVALALFDVFLGEAPVSPSLKASVSNKLATILK